MVKGLAIKYFYKPFEAIIVALADKFTFPVVNTSPLVLSQKFSGISEGIPYPIP